MDPLLSELEAARNFVEKMILSKEHELARSRVQCQETKADMAEGAAIALFDVLLYLEGRINALRE